MCKYHLELEIVKLLINEPSDVKLNDKLKMLRWVGWVGLAIPFYWKWVSCQLESPSLGSKSPSSKLPLDGSAFLFYSRLGRGHSNACSVVSRGLICFLSEHQAARPCSIWLNSVLVQGGNLLYPTPLFGKKAKASDLRHVKHQLWTDPLV